MHDERPRFLLGPKRKLTHVEPTAGRRFLLGPKRRLTHVEPTARKRAVA